MSDIKYIDYSKLELKRSILYAGGTTIMMNLITKETTVKVPHYTPINSQWILDEIEAQKEECERVLNHV